MTMFYMNTNPQPPLIFPTTVPHWDTQPVKYYVALGPRNERCLVYSSSDIPSLRVLQSP